MAFTLIVSMEAVLIAMLLSIYAKKMLKLIDNLSNGMGNPENSSKIPTSYLDKVRKMVFRVVVLFPSIGMILIFTPTMYFVTGYLPYSYIFSSLTIFNIPIIIILVSTIYASNSKRITIFSQSSPSKTSSKRFDGQVVSDEQQLKYTLTVANSEKPSST